MTLKDARALRDEMRLSGPPDLRPTVPLGHGPDRYFVKFWDVLTWQTGYIYSREEWLDWATRYNAKLARIQEKCRAWHEKWDGVVITATADAEGRYNFILPRLEEVTS